MSAVPRSGCRTMMRKGTATIGAAATRTAGLTGCAQRDVRNHTSVMRKQILKNSEGCTENVPSEIHRRSFQALCYAADEAPELETARA